jgi:hypothetical protein
MGFTFIMYWMKAKTGQYPAGTFVWRYGDLISGLTWVVLLSFIVYLSYSYSWFFLLSFFVFPVFGEIFLRIVGGWIQLYLWGAIPILTWFAVSKLV